MEDFSNPSRIGEPHSPAWRDAHVKAGDESIIKAHEIASSFDVQVAPSLPDIEKAKVWALIAQAHYYAADMLPPDPFEGLLP